MSLTDEEMAIVTDLGGIWDRLCSIVGRDSSRSGDLSEACSHIHALQHMVMAQSAARQHPDKLRLLGERVTSGSFIIEPPAPVLESGSPGS